MEVFVEMEEGLIIPREEYRERQRRAAERCRERGLVGLLAWSRGAHTGDRYADVMYLANAYTDFPHIEDVPPYWSGRGHCAVVLPAEGEPTLVIDSYPGDEPMVGDVRRTARVLEAVAEAMREEGMERGRVGVAGAGVLSFDAYRKLAAALPGCTLEPADDILRDLRLIKSEAEQRIIRHVCRLASEAMTIMMEAVQPGRTDADMVAEATAFLIRRGVAVYGFAISSGPKVGHYTSTASPAYEHRRQLQRGDALRVDFYGAYRGYIFDFSRSTVVGGGPKPAEFEPLEFAVGAVETVITALRPGRTIGEAAQAGNGYLTQAGKQPAAAFPAWGHSLGLVWEGPWITADENTVITPGMYLAVERRGFEENLLVTSDGVEVLTTAKKRWW